jgi:hypothetical protein
MKFSPSVPRRCQRLGQLVVGFVWVSWEAVLGHNSGQSSLRLILIDMIRRVMDNQPLKMNFLGFLMHD